MTENEAVEAMQFDLKIGGEIHSQVLRDAVDVAIQALEKVEQYRAIGTPEELQDMKSNYFEALSDWRQYRKIGTLEECLKNKDFLDFLSDKMNPNDFETYLRLYNALEEKGCEE